MTSTPQNQQVRYGCRIPSNRPVNQCPYRNEARAFNASSSSILALAPESTIDNSGFTQFIRLSVYCKQKYITRYQATLLIKNRLLAAIKQGGKIWVAERCPDQIKDLLNVSITRCARGH